MQDSMQLLYPCWQINGDTPLQDCCPIAQTRLHSAPCIVVRVNGVAKAQPPTNNITADIKTVLSITVLQYSAGTESRKIYDFQKLV